MRVQETDVVGSSYEVGTKKGERLRDDLRRRNYRPQGGYHPFYSLLRVAIGAFRLTRSGKTKDNEYAVTLSFYKDIDPKVALSVKPDA